MKNAGYWSMILGLLTGCASTLPQIPDSPERASTSQPAPEPLRTVSLLHFRALPGVLNQVPVFYSNRPELLKTPGEILDSATLSGQNTLSGSFAVFAHHVVETAPFDFSGFRLGLLVRPANATARSTNAVTLTLHNAFIARTQPDAPFVPTAPILKQTDSQQIVSGPGDAMAWAPEKALLTQSPPTSFTFDQEILLTDIEVPTFPLGLGIIGERNAVSAWLDFSASAPVKMRWVALKTPGSMADIKEYQEAAKEKAGPAELPATEYDPQGPPPGGVFRFGRVAGIAQGTAWTGDEVLSAQDLESLERGERLAWPIATTYTKSWAGQNQSAPLLARQEQSAVESHGNYGLAYRVGYSFSNPTPKPLTLNWRWTQPSAVKTPGILSYDPKTQIVFRGSVRVKHQCQINGVLKPPDLEVYHLQVQQGHWHVPFYEQALPAHSQCHLTFEWIYPPDAIPPQVLSVEKKP